MINKYVLQNFDISCILFPGLFVSLFVCVCAIEREWGKGGGGGTALLWRERVLPAEHVEFISEMNEVRQVREREGAGIREGFSDTFRAVYYKKLHLQGLSYYYLPYILVLLSPSQSLPPLLSHSLSVFVCV